ncbi:MAG: TAXI family TRAP transporter solute-binding subunit [Deltaproteobacteria bacterium]|nr:TAXI family TRAP transporter solute-binding subunit [Deltaproteobacteria bacterium]
MKKMLLIMTAVLFCFSFPAQGQDLKSPVHLRLASQDLGSAWYVYGANFAKLWRNVLPRGSTIDVLPYGGGPANSFLIEKGDADLALSFTAVANWAVQGKVLHKKKIETIRGLAGSLDRYYLAVIATKRSGITSLEEVAKKKLPARFVSQPVGSTAESSMPLLFAAYGMSLEDIKSWGGSVTPTSTGVAQAQMTDGKADIWIQVVTAGHPAVSELALSTELNFLPASEEVIKKMMESGFEKTVLPAKVFKGQDKEVPYVGFPTVLIGHQDLKPEVAYLLTKTIVENRDALMKAHAGFKDFKPEEAWKLPQYGIPLHPGAEKYYRDKGMMK